MKQKNKNFSGRIIPPWYDADGICFFMLFFMFLVFLFSIVGIFTALEHPESSLYIKIPVTLLILSLLVLVSLISRLIKRRRVNKSLESLSLYK